MIVSTASNWQKKSRRRRSLRHQIAQQFLGDLRGVRVAGLPPQLDIGAQGIDQRQLVAFLLGKHAALVGARRAGLLDSGTRTKPGGGHRPGWRRRSRYHRPSAASGSV